MDLIAALALVMIIEGLALAVFARSIPQVLAEIDQINPNVLRKLGVIGVLAGAALYLWVR